MPGRSSANIEFARTQLQLLGRKSRHEWRSTGCSHHPCFGWPRPQLPCISGAHEMLQSETGTAVTLISYICRCCLNRWQAIVEVVEGREVGTIRGGSGRTGGSMHVSRLYKNWVEERCCPGSWRRAEVTGAPGRPPTPRPPHTPPPPPPSRSTARLVRCHPGDRHLLRQCLHFVDVTERDQ